METAKAYDSLPYPSKFFFLTNPDHLATLAKLHGLAPARPETSRVLELGCGNGSNLIAHAYNLQDATFVGIDISPVHIRDARESTKALGLTNVEFRETDLTVMTPEEFGNFDYIVAHGLISWIPEEVRDRVFAIYSEMLEPNGIGFISYNAYPGAHYRNMVRGIMRYHTRNTDDPREKVQRSLEFLSLLTENVTEKKVIAPILRHELDRHFGHSESDIYHDDLAEAYRPMYFHEFNDKLEKNGMQFLCEAEFHAMSMHGFSSEVREFASSIEDLIEREQYLDFFRGRIFRQTLFCRENLKIERDIQPDVLDSFQLAGSVQPASAVPDITGQTAERFEGSRGVGIEIDHPLTKAVLSLLRLNWGKAVKLDTLLQDARQTLEAAGYQADDWEPHFRTVKAILLRIYEGTDLINLHLYYADVDQKVSESPRINELARWQLDHADNVTSLYGLNISVADEVYRRLLVLLDGTRNLSNLRVEMGQFIETLDDFDGKDDLLRDLDKWMEESLNEVGKLGLFSS